MASRTSGYIIILLLVLLLSLAAIHEDVQILLSGSSTIEEPFTGNLAEDGHPSQISLKRQPTKAMTHAQALRLGISDELHPVAVVLPFDPPLIRHTDPITDRLTVNWMGFTVSGMPITLYRLYFRFNQGSWQEWGEFSGMVTSAEFVIPNEEDGVYEFEATAVGNAGEAEERSGLPEAFIFVDRYPPYIQDEWVITLHSLQKNTPGLSSRYEVTNTATQEAITAHAFYDINDNLRTFFLADIHPGENRTYDLATIAELTDGYRGYVVIYSDQPIEAMLLDARLLARHLPYIYVHHWEEYWPVEIDGPVRASELHFGSGAIRRNPWPYDLGNEPYNDPGSFLNLPGDGITGGPQREWWQDNEAQFSRTIYGRIYRNDPNHIALQYWFFYYDNPHLNHHEGDWENILVVLDDNETPLYAAYSHHESGSRRSWENVPTLNDAGQRPEVFVAEGSHASYFTPGIHYGLSNGIVDRAGNVPLNPQPELTLALGTEPWLNFEGEWGEEGSILPCFNSSDWDNGPRGPRWTNLAGCDLVVLNPRWIDPIVWALGLRPDEDAAYNQVGTIRGSIAAPFNLLLNEAPLEGVLLQDSVSEFSPEYFDNPITSRRTALLNNPDPDTPYLMTVVTDAPIGPATLLTINLPDFQNNLALTATYTLSNTWTPASDATILLSAQSDLLLSVDINGDGIDDYQIMPTVTSSSLDLTAPAAVLDLHTTVGEYGQVLFQWTSPGDDGNMGSAYRYELRYYTQPITDANWGLATPIDGLPIPSSAGTLETFDLPDPPSGNYFFALISIDDAFLHSKISNNINFTTQIRLHLPIIVKS